MKRFTQQSPCPVCGGYDSQKRKIGKRCYGFISGDRKYAHCTREKYAGDIPLNKDSETFAHILHGQCNCGQEHGGENNRGQSGKIAAIYSYRDAQRNPLFQVVRIEPKSFRQRRPVGKGWKWNLDGVTKTLYRLPELLTAKESRTVFVVEGEKDADALATLGLVTTTNPGGAGKWEVRFSEILRGRKVAIVPDNDRIGRSHAAQVAKSLAKVAKAVRIVTLPDVPLHGDVSDWLASGGTKGDLFSLIKKTAEFVITDQNQEIIFRTPVEMAALKGTSVEWIAPPFVAAGCITDIVGKVKAAGKTTFVTNLASALVRGHKFLGFQTVRTPVVYLTEQPWTSWMEALRRARLSERHDFFSLLWGDVVQQPWEKVLKAAAAECERRNSRILVIDTLAPFAGLSGATENDSGHALAAMRPLQAITELGIAVIIVQHERKTGGDVGQSARGSTAFAGAVDTILSLSRREGRTQANFRELKSLSRFSETPASLLIELTDKGYVCHGECRPIATEQAQSAILEVLPRVKIRALTLDQILGECGASRTSAQRALTVLREAGKVLRTGKGTKTSPRRFWCKG